VAAAALMVCVDDDDLDFGFWIFSTQVCMQSSPRVAVSRHLIRQNIFPPYFCHNSHRQRYILPAIFAKHDD